VINTAVDGEASSAVRKRTHDDIQHGRRSDRTRSQLGKEPGTRSCKWVTRPFESEPSSYGGLCDRLVDVSS
jgi:hypothetical protein